MRYAAGRNEHCEDCGEHVCCCPPYYRCCNDVFIVRSTTVSSVQALDGQLLRTLERQPAIRTVTCADCGRVVEEGK